MVALIGAEEDQAQAVCDEASKGEVLVPANFNAPGQIVLSGAASACERAIATAEAMGLKAKGLSVAGAFHSPLMEPAAEGLAKALEDVEFSEPEPAGLEQCDRTPSRPRRPGFHQIETGAAVDQPGTMEPVLRINGPDAAGPGRETPGMARTGAGQRAQRPLPSDRSIRQGEGPRQARSGTLDDGGHDPC